jgi:ATP/ADP translocase
MDAYARFFAGFEKWRNIGVLAAASLATAPLLAGPGVGITLSTVPATILACGSLFLLAPGMGTVLLLKGLEEGQRHAWFKAAKETVYTVAGRDVIYRVKGYVDMFLYRLCRGIAGFILLVLQTAGFGPTACVAASLPLALVWLCCAWKLGGEYQRLEREGSSGA